MKQHIFTLPRAEQAHPQPWLTLHDDGRVQFGRQQPTESPALVYNNYQPEPLPAPRTGLRLKSLATGEVEWFEYHPRLRIWKRHATLTPVGDIEYQRNGCTLKRCGAIKLRGRDDAFEQFDAIAYTCEEYDVTCTKQGGAGEPLFVWQNSTELSWAYYFDGTTWYHVLPKEWKPPVSFTRPVPAGLQSSGVYGEIEIPIRPGECATVGPVTLHAESGRIEFGNVLYRQNEPLESERYFGYTATRERGVAQLLTITPPSHVAATEGVLRLKFQNGYWYRYVPVPPTFANAVREQVQIAIHFGIRYIVPNIRRIVLLTLMLALVAHHGWFVGLAILVFIILRVQSAQ